MWRIEFHVSVYSDIKRIPKKVLSSIKKVLELLKEVPECVKKKPLRGYKNFFSIRVSDYRVIIEIVRSEKVFRVWMIDHRKRVYKRLGDRVDPDSSRGPS